MKVITSLLLLKIFQSPMNRETFRKVISNSDKLVPLQQIFVTRLLLFRLLIIPKQDFSTLQHRIQIWSKFYSELTALYHGRQWWSNRVDPSWNSSVLWANTPQRNFRLHPCAFHINTSWKCLGPLGASLAVYWLCLCIP